ncbi:HAD hydrolase-like protein [Verrucomicrobia bacterium]|nr:HAD hydrolase-like protein [Verrucomicrobiota bacterium]NCG26548.1 HAD hydrolase-like protein [Verrucomicrobiales bacterium]
MSDLPQVILFDIDGTLLSTGGAGMKAFYSAIENNYPAQLKKCGGSLTLDMAGSTDSGLVIEIFAALGIEDSATERESFFAEYLQCLKNNLSDPSYTGSLMPGISELLDRLSYEANNGKLILGLLTGNIFAGAALKLKKYRVDEYFFFGAYGDDHHDRNELGPIALKRGGSYHKLELTGAPVTVIGDTPKDIYCARAMGAQAVAVSSGSISHQELANYDPDLLFKDFTDYEDAYRRICLG